MSALPDPDDPVVHVHTRAQGGLGCMSRRVLDRRVHQGEVAPDDVFWFRGMDEWQEIRHHPELFEDLSSGRPRRPARPVETLEPALLEPAPQTVHSVGHSATTPSPKPPTPATPAPALSLAEDPSLELTGERTWMPEHDEESSGELLPSAGPDSTEPASPFPPHSEVSDSWPSLPLDADALVPTDTALGASTRTDDALEVPAGSPPQAVPANPLPTMPPAPHLDAIFADLLEGSWDYAEATDFASCVDEVFLGAVITSALDAGRLLIDLSSDGTHHFLRFEHPEDSSRVLLRLTHLTGNLTTSRVQGHMASLMIGYGERVKGFGEIWARLSSESDSGLVPPDLPGTLVTDGDVASQYVYVQVRLYLRIDDYVSPDWSIDHDRLRDHLTACVRALRVHLYGRLR